MKMIMSAILINRSFRAVICIAAATLSILLASCEARKNTAKSEKEVKTEGAPEWVAARPQSGAYYIGIGSSSKKAQPLDYQTIAKKNALNDLASEISVRVQGQTFLNSLEVNKNFSEEFISTISTTTDERIENFEVAGVWENQEEYWTYYRLNKSEYQRLKREKKNMAMNAANDYYLKGKGAEASANIPAAFDLYMRGLFAVQEYWDEVNEYDAAGGKIFIDNEIYGSLQRICTGMVINSQALKVVLSSENAYNANLALTVTYEGKPVRGITLTYNYKREHYMKPRPAITDEVGKILANVSEVNANEKSNSLDVNIDLEPLLSSDLDRTIQKGLVKGMRTEGRQIPIELVTPSFFITSEEKVFGKNASGTLLLSAMNAELLRNGMRISPSEKETNFRVSIQSNTTEGGTSQGFYVAFLEMTVAVRNVSTGDIVYQESLNSIKGLQLNKDAAGIEAYKKGKEKIENEMVKSILSSIM